jgi:hypothetical protein
LIGVGATDRADQYLMFDANGDLTVGSEVTLGSLTATAYMQARLADIDNASELLAAAGALADGNSVVTEAKIAASAVTENKIANSAVTENKIANSAVTLNKIANNAVSKDKMATGGLGKWLGYDDSTGAVVEKNAPLGKSVFTSTEVTPSASTVHSWNHGLSSAPILVAVYLKRTAAAAWNGYAQNDIVPLATHTDFSGGGTTGGTGIRWNATAVSVAIPAGLRLFPASGSSASPVAGQITLSDWKIFVRAWL